MNFVRWQPLSLLVALLLLIIPGLNAETRVLDEEKYAMLQAAYLFNIAKFISWPEPTSQPFRLCLLGSQALKLEPYFTQAFAERALAQRQVKIQAWTEIVDSSELASCQLLYLTSLVSSAESLLASPASTLGITAPEVPVMDMFLFDLKMESGRIAIYHNRSAQSTFQLPINAALLRITRPLPGASP